MEGEHPAQLQFYPQHPIITNIIKQSPDISQGVNTGGAGDQGIMYGYATDETPEMLPKAIVLVHRLTKGLEELRRSGQIPWLKPDGKSQVTMGDGAIKTILVSCQHAETVSQDEIRRTLIKKLIRPLVDNPVRIEILVNPTGKFVRGGFAADTGVTGRKIMVDTYGGLIPHGGGSFSGKDPTKVDRSAAYMCRRIAVDLLKKHHAQQVKTKLVYAIGVKDPVMGVAEIDGEIGPIEGYDVTPRGIINFLQLDRPIYAETAKWGHHGRGFPWG
ncbi:MAG: methionine adenosyltransferase domain-containing protein [candidate division WWE3 bacterium]|nr:methionine adenosyltransferase domain-containing protein [candidate division WWE3 bacterium]